MRTLKRMVDYAQKLISNIVKNGDIVIDATAGNGNDTVFLANLVGNSGKVYSFDIQRQAINNTGIKLKNLGLLNIVELINDSHERVTKYIDEYVNAAMFNLGYLPGGNHDIITKPKSTENAINHILDLLVVGGIITIVIYYGHEGGLQEKTQILEFLTKLDSIKFEVQKLESLNHNNPPMLVCIEKKK